MRVLIFIITFFLQTTIFCQFLKPELECFYGSYYYKRNTNVSDIKRQGLTTMASVRLHLNITKHFSLIPGIGVDRIYVYYSPINAEFFLSLHLGYKLKLKNSPSTSFFTSMGIEIESTYGTKIPIIFGLETEVSETVNWMFRTRLPSLIDTKFTELYDYTEIGLEIGLKVWLKNNKPPEPIHKYGNPFILQ